MSNKLKQLFSTLLAAVVIVGALGLFVAFPLAASAVTRDVGSELALEDAIQNAVSGDTIRLTADITYNRTIIVDTAKTITFDLNGKTLNATAGVFADKDAKILLADPNNGQLNVSGVCSNDAADTVVAWNGSSKVEVSNVSSSAIAVYAQDNSEIIVYGNVTHTGTSGIGPFTLGNGKITVNGTITVSDGVKYIQVGSAEKTEEQYEATSGKSGYREYKGTHNGYTSHIWVKIPVNATASPTAVTFDKTTGGDIAVTVDTAGYTPQNIKNGGYTLQAGTDFTISGNIVSLKATYLNSLDPGIYTLTFEFSGGVNPTLVVTVSGAAPIAPSISGPATMTLAQGYAATSSGAFTITGDPAPIVEITSGDAKITWDNGAKKLNIAAGITPGTYQVILKAANGTTPDAMFTFSLTVTASGTTFPFADVPTTAWYYNDVKNAYETGLINGISATAFAPDNNLTYAETVKLAACMHQLSATGSVMLTNGSPNWYDSYVDYAKANGIINKDYSWNTSATRAGYMEIFANAVALSSINSIADGSILDVPTTHPQAASIYKLYRAGIVQGVDAAHNCNPDSNIKRSEVAAILTRMMDADKRISFSM
ncbi:MAG: S-layer homology domain-containing protein [Peptococcaceae bacterium]|nr:S-layer homology domain-containing protein [Peptococcaceae bacterium]